MKVYISYAQADHKTAGAIADALRAAGHEPWYVDAEVLAGENLARRAGEALENSEAMVVVISPASMKSTWVRSDINFALGTPKYSGGRLIPVKIRQTNEVPWILERINLIDVTHRLSDAGKRVVSALRKAHAVAG